MYHHLLGIFGLTLNIAGVGLLLRFPPVVKVYIATGSEVIVWVNTATPEGKQRYRFQLWGYRIAIAALALGFLLQLIDLVYA